MTKLSQEDFSFEEKLTKSDIRMLSPEEKVKALQEIRKELKAFLDWAGITPEEFLANFEKNREAHAKRYFEKNYGLKTNK